MSQSATANATHTAIFAHYCSTLFRQSEPLYTLVEYWSILRHALKRFLVRLYPPVLQCEQPLYEHCERKSIKHNQIAKASLDINSNGSTGGVSVAWLMEQVILRLGYGIDEGLFSAEVTLWRFFPYTPPPYQQKQKPKKLEERQL